MVLTTADMTTRKDRMSMDIGQTESRRSLLGRRDTLYQSSCL